MLKKIFLLFLIVTVQNYAYQPIDKTVELHNELQAHQNPNITGATHPVLYEMIEKLCQKANVSTPRYISTFAAQFILLDQYNEQRRVRPIQAYVDVMGDLHICYELIRDLSYDEVEGIIAIAIAEKSQNQSIKLASIGVGTFAATIATFYALHKTHDIFAPMRNWSKDGVEIAVQGIMLTPFVSAILAIVLASNYFQKSADLKATQLTSAKNVINGIKGTDIVKDAYEKEGFFSRVAKSLNLKKFTQTIFYPIRAYNTQERIAYLEQV